MNYWVIIDRHKYGPLTLTETRSMPLTPDSYVWHSGLPGWVRARELEELADLFAAAEPEPQPTPQEDAEIEIVVETEDVQAPEEIHEAPRPVPPPPPPPPVFNPKQHASRPVPPPSYLGWCIASIILCCLIPGIVATIYASKVTPLYNSGDYEGARKASDRAELWLIITITVGIVWAPFSLFLSLL